MYNIRKNMLIANMRTSVLRNHLINSPHVIRLSRKRISKNGLQGIFQKKEHDLNKRTKTMANALIDG